jgi:hypothetical protein
LIHNRLFLNARSRKWDSGNSEFRIVHPSDLKAFLERGEGDKSGLPFEWSEDSAREWEQKEASGQQERDSLHFIEAEERYYVAPRQQEQVWRVADRSHCDGMVRAIKPMPILHVPISHRAKAPPVVLSPISTPKSPGSSSQPNEMLELHPPSRVNSWVDPDAILLSSRIQPVIEGRKSVRAMSMLGPREEALLRDDEEAVKPMDNNDWKDNQEELIERSLSKSKNSPMSRKASEVAEPSALSDLWAALEITLELTKALKANGITSATAKAMQDKLGVKELSDIQELGEEELQRLERQGVKALQMKKIKALIAKSSKFRP